MAPPILKDLPELIEAQVISAETAAKIRLYYAGKHETSENRQFMAFAVLGALLSGLGLILIVAHNWDEFSRQTKTGLAFLPLLLGQAACGWVLLQKPAARTWREASATFLFLAIGATIALISQIYHLPGNLSGFLLTWSLLGLPLVYLMRSGAASLLYLAGSTYYLTETNLWSLQNDKALYYWPLLAAGLPFYFNLLRQAPESNFTRFHNWLLPFSGALALGTLAERTEELMFIAYMSLFAFYMQAGSLPIFKGQKKQQNGFVILGAGGTIMLLLGLTFNDFWDKLASSNLAFPALLLTPEFAAAALLTAVAGWLFGRKVRKGGAFFDLVTEGVFLAFPIVFFLGLAAPKASQILINLLVLALGISVIRRGAKSQQLATLNLGLLVVAALVFCRFFDTDLSFVIRGILFLLVGAGFFAANYYLLKTRKTL